MSKTKYYVVSLSGGKDSTAMLLRLLEEHRPIDRILFCDTGLEFPHINKSAYKPKGGVQKLKATKSVSSNRTVYYGEEVEEALLSWQATQQAYKKERKITWREQDYVFTTDTGDMISVYAPTRICSRFEEKYGLRHLKLHGLRHTCGSLMIKNGVDRVTVSKWLGHESTDVTEIYVHSYEDSLVAASQALDRAVRKENLGENTKYTGGSS